MSLAAVMLPHDLKRPKPDELVAALETLTIRMARCDALEPLLRTTLAGLAELFAYPRPSILLGETDGWQLYRLESSRLRRSSVGAGRPGIDGAIPTTDSLGGRDRTAVPLLARVRLLGVLCVEGAADRPTRAEEQALNVLAHHLATSIQLFANAPPGPEAAGPQVLQIKYHPSDDSVFVDGEYLIKGIPGRILHWLLDAYQRERRTEFSNKQLRVDAGLRLSPYRDNLEARLILLRRRLEAQDVPLRLVRVGRGRFRLELMRALHLSVAP